MGSLVKTCTTFPQERTIVTRERSKRSYEVGPYFLAKLLAELPIGALFPGVFGTLVYPTTGLHRKWSRYQSCTCLSAADHHALRQSWYSSSMHVSWYCPAYRCMHRAGLLVCFSNSKLSVY